MSTIFDQHLGKNAANYVALSPVSFVERSAEVFADLPAVVHGARRYTWLQTRERSARLAAALQALGVKRGSTVSAMLPNTPEMVEAHYAVPALNAVLNTQNTRLDAPLLAWQLNHCEAQVLITDREFAPVMAEALRLLRTEHQRDLVELTCATANTPAPASAWARMNTKPCWPPMRRWRAWKARPTNGTPLP
jgi:fatty-acyl-CoA synthase